jgi:hypothetical protein
VKDEMASDDRSTKKKVKLAVIDIGRGGGVFLLDFEMNMLDFCWEVVGLTGILVFVWLLLLLGRRVIVQGN